jgi:hypothetical protein
MTDLARFPTFLRDLLNGCPAAGSGVHSWLFRTAKRLHEHGVPAAGIIELLRAGARACGRTVSDKEIADAVSSSLKVANLKIEGESYEPGSNQSPWPKPDFVRIARLVAEGSSLYDLWERSPARFDATGGHADEIIDVLFPGNPLLCCGQSNVRFATRRRELWRGHLERLALLVPGPMLTVKGHTQEGRESEHTLKSTCARVYLVIEFDFSEFARDGKTETPWTPLVREWKAIGLTLADAGACLHLHLAKRQPLVAAVHSGGKSLHGWYAAFNHTEAQLRSFMHYAVSLGADRATWTRSQFVRMPDGIRENGKRQICFYLDPAEAVKL